MTHYLVVSCLFIYNCYLNTFVANVFFYIGSLQNSKFISYQSDGVAEHLDMKDRDANFEKIAIK